MCTKHENPKLPPGVRAEEIIVRFVRVAEMVRIEKELFEIWCCCGKYVLCGNKLAILR